MPDHLLHYHHSTLHTTIQHTVDKNKIDKKWNSMKNERWVNRWVNPKQWTGKPLEMMAKCWVWVNVPDINWKWIPGCRPCNSKQAIREACPCPSYHNIVLRRWMQSKVTATSTELNFVHGLCRVWHQTSKHITCMLCTCHTLQHFYLMLLSQTSPVVFQLEQHMLWMACQRLVWLTWLLLQMTCICDVLYGEPILLVINRDYML